jgi:hypothetical protein
MESKLPLWNTNGNVQIMIVAHRRRRRRHNAHANLVMQQQTTYALESDIALSEHPLARRSGRYWRQHSLSGSDER